MTSSAKRALRVLDIVNAAASPIGVTAVAELAQTPPGTAFRSLDALERCGFVTRYRASTQYTTGEATSRLKQSLFAKFRLRDVCLPFLKRLTYATSETTTLTVPVGWYGVRVAVVAGTSAVRSAAASGLVGPLTQDFASKAILASYSDEELTRFRAASKRLGIPKALFDRLELELGEIRRLGYATEPVDFAPGRVALALPIRWQGHAIGAIGLNGPVIVSATGPAPADLALWNEAIAEIEQLIAAQPELADNPFAHMDPMEIVLNTPSSLGGSTRYR
jgi:DNA-binding IclR family transcriptional regulator